MEANGTFTVLHPVRVRKSVFQRVLGSAQLREQNSREETQSGRHGPSFTYVKRAVGSRNVRAQEWQRKGEVSSPAGIPAGKGGWQAVVMRRTPYRTCVLTSS